MKQLRNLILFIGILITTGMMILFLSITNLLVLVPWDTAIFRPEIGTWQRTLNDFFEGRTGENIVFLTVALVSILPILRRLRRRWGASLRIIIANLLFFFGGYIFLMMSFIVNNAIFPWHPPASLTSGNNYTKSILPLIVLWILYAVWFHEIAGLAKHRIQRKSKAKNTEFHQASNRLSDHTSLENDGDYYHEALATKQQSRSQ